MVTRVATFHEVVLQTLAGSLLRCDVACWVEEENRSHGMAVGRTVMQALGYSTDALLVAALGK